jgi:predicted ATPase
MHLLTKFKGFSDTGIELLNPFVLLIGRNGSGKTNAIEGIELLAHLAQGTALGDITDVNTLAGQLQIRGGLQGCVDAKSKHFILGFRGGRVSKATNIFYQIEVKAGTTAAQIVRESLSFTDSKGKSRIFFEIVADSEVNHAGAMRVKYDNFAQGGNKPTLTARGDRSFLSQVSALIPRNKKNEGAHQVATAVQSHLRAAFAFDPASKTMRGYVRQGQRNLLRDGSNISSVLHSLSIGSEEDKAALARITEAIRTMPEEPISSIEFVTTEIGDVILALKSSDSNRSLIDARVLSDGTLRALAILTAAETAESGSRLSIEELDNGVHPSRVAGLVRHIIECGKRRKLNILCTTHNPVLLDQLEPGELDTVVVCHRGTEGSLLTPLNQIPRVQEILVGGRLGDLVTRNVIEKYLQPNYDNQRRENLRRVLEELR